MAPGVRAGKFSQKYLYNKNSGISASSYLSSNPAPFVHPLNGGEVVPWVSSVDYNKPWFTAHESGDYFCTLCNAFATEGHVESQKHKDREQNPAWYMGGDSAVLTAEYDKPWFEDRQGQWYCLLCNQWATDGHLGGDKHRKREQAPEYYGTWPGQEQAFNGGSMSGAASSSTPTTGNWPAPQPSPNEPWLESREGHLYCCLCSAWATDGHLGSDRHKKRAAAPEWYWEPPGGASFPAAAASSLPALAASAHGEEQRPRSRLPAGWVEYFSKEHNTHYYHNAVTNETTWTHPSQGSGGMAPPAATNGASWSVPQPAAAAYPAATQAPAAAALPAPADPRASRPPCPPGWNVHFSEEQNNWYYHNLATGTTTWEAPAADASAQAETLEV